jgi:hypothetical protein
MNITNTMCRLEDLTQEQIDSLVDAMPSSDFYEIDDTEMFIGVKSNGTWGTWYGNTNPKIIPYKEMMKLLGKTMEFTKSDLKTGVHVIKNRDGDYKIVLDTILCGNSYTALNLITETLSHKNYIDLDIMAVYVITEKRSINSYLTGEGLSLIWERTEQTPAQKELSLLQEQITALQEQAKVLQAKL